MLGTPAGPARPRALRTGAPRVPAPDGVHPAPVARGRCQGSDRWRAPPPATLICDLTTMPSRRPRAPAASGDRLAQLLDDLLACAEAERLGSRPRIMPALALGGSWLAS